MIKLGDKASGQISKRVLQENKARQILRKTNITYPLIRTRTCAYQMVRNVRFSENLTCFVFSNTHLRIALLPQCRRKALYKNGRPPELINDCSKLLGLLYVSLHDSEMTIMGQDVFEIFF